MLTGTDPEGSHHASTLSKDGQDRYTGHETILVVDDDEDVRQLLEHMLAAHGYTVITARDAPSAMSMAEQYVGEIDLLLADIMLPGPTGHELATHLAALRPHLKTLYMSGDHRRSLVVDGPVVSAAPFVPKPFTDTLMLRALRDLLDAR